MENLIYDRPSSAGMTNVLKRARQLAGLRWTPVKPFPVIMTDAQSGCRQHLFLPAWRPRIGVNYSAVRYDEKYVGSNVSTYTYVTAMSNPDSVLYTRPLFGRNVLGAAFYGSVCSQYVSYAFDLPFQIDCGQWPSLPGIREIKPETLDELQLCDVLNDPKRHTALITGIGRTKDGHAAEIIVSEATSPSIRVTSFSLEEFRKFWLAKGNFQILRFDPGRFSCVTYEPDPFCPVPGDPEMPQPPINEEIMPDYGDKANYMLGTPVVFRVPDAGYSEVVIRQGAAETSVVSCAGNRASFLPDAPGYYSAAARGSKGSSKPIHFCVTDASVTLQKTVFCPGEPVRPHFTCAAEDPLVGWVIKTREFAKVWGYPATEDGSVPEEGTVAPGQYLVIALYKNRYGTYSSTPCYFDVAAE